MRELTLVKRIAVLIAIPAAAIFAVAAGLMLMNLRADWALVLGALICVAAPILAGVRLYSMLKEDRKL